MFNRNKRMTDFDRSFNRMNKLVLSFIGIVFTVIVLYWAFIAFVAVSVVVNPEGTGQAVGNFVGSITRGIDEGFNR